MNVIHFRRAWGATKIRYPFFQVFSSNKKTSFLLITFFLITNALAIAYIFDFEFMSTLNSNPIIQGLLGFSLELMIVAFLGVGLLIVKTLTATESERINNNQRTINNEVVRNIPQNLIVSLLGRDIFFKFDHTAFYEMPKMLDASFRWAEFDREEFYLVKAGALDKPKLCLRKITSDQNGLIFHLGASSFYDVFFTHYSPDLSFSSQSANELSSGEANSIRGVLRKSIDKFYSKDLTISLQASEFDLFDFVPNPLGLSGILILHCEDGHAYVPLRIRQTNEVASQNEIEWSFAGLIEASDWLHTKRIDKDDLIDVEFIDECQARFDALRYSLASAQSSRQVIGMTLNPLFLYQPEIYVVVEETNVEVSVINNLRKEINPEKHLLAKVSELEGILAKEKTKNLFGPGLDLLKLARPNLF